MSFLTLSNWELNHYINAPKMLVDKVGDINGLRILDIGCGDGMMDLGIARLGAEEVIGIDVKEVSSGLLQSTASRLNELGFMDAQMQLENVKLQTYNGINFPFEDESFDVVMSWGAFEHILDVKSVLLEMKRVMKASGIGFINVFPWFHSYYGSHLSDYLPPFAHLKMDEGEIKQRLEENLNLNQEAPRELIMNHVWPEYVSLNKYSANMFYRDFRACGWKSHIWTPLCSTHDLADAPENMEYSDLVITGGDVVFRK